VFRFLDKRGIAFFNFRAVTGSQRSIS